MTANVQTLTESFTAGRMPWNDALRYGAQIIDSLRHAHDEGRCHGALTPDAVILSATGVELVPAPAGEPVRVTAYTAPERLAGGAPDARADIFSLGALLYEMFTGRRAFSGETPEELAAAIENSIPEPIGDTGLDRLVSNCLVKDPAGRWQRLQQVHMEFRILTFSAKRAQQLSAPRQHFALQADLRKVEDQLSARIDQQWAEAAAGLRQVSAELPLLESQLAVRLDQQAAETAAALRHISAELPLMESHLASGLAERFGEAMSALQHLAAELPLVEGRFASRLEQQDGALARAQESIAELPQLESRLTARIEQNESALAGVPEIESRLSSRLEQNENALTGVQQSIAELPQLESRLTARIDQHENTLAGVPEIESRLSSRLEQQNVLVESLQQAAAEQRTVVETVSRSVASVDERIVSLDAKFCATYESAQHAERAASQFAEMQSSLIEELREIGTTVKSHTAAIESIRTSMARTDDFMERIVEALESLQSMVLDPARDRVGA